MGRIAIYAGSFDPITLGHLDVIERASKLFDQLIVLVTVNPNKKSSFSLEQRKKMIAESTKGLDNIKIDSHEGLLADYVNENNIDVVVRGLRNTDDFNNEYQMAHLNANLYTGNTETVFLLSAPEHSFISSSAVKEIATLGGDISNLVPRCVKEAIILMEE